MHPNFFIFIIFLSLFLQKIDAQETFLFTFEKEGRKSYLMGTSHGIHPSRLPTAVTSTLLKLNVLVTENGDNQKSIDEKSALAMGILRSTTDLNYVDQLDNDDRLELLKYVEPFLVEKGGEIQVSQLNLKGLYAAYIGGHFLNGMDYWLLKSFKEAGKLILGIETFQSIAPFFEEPDFLNFQQIIKHKAGFESEQAEKMENDYLSGVIPLEDPEFEEEMKQRNPGLFRGLISFHQQFAENMGSPLGLDHLFGKYGILKLFQENGYSLKRMKSTGEFVEFKIG